MLKPLFPFVSDALSHTLNESIHIGTVHAIYGSHHLAKDVASATSEDRNTNQTSSRSEETVSLHIVLEHATIILRLLSSIAAFALFRIKKWTTVYLSLQLPPPKYFL